MFVGLAGSASSRGHASCEAAAAGVDCWSTLAATKKTIELVKHHRASKHNRQVDYLSGNICEYGSRP